MDLSFRICLGRKIKICPEARRSRGNWELRSHFCIVDSSMCRIELINFMYFLFMYFFFPNVLRLRSSGRFKRYNSCNELPSEGFIGVKNKLVHRVALTLSISHIIIFFSNSQSS